MSSAKFENTGGVEKTERAKSPRVQTQHTNGNPDGNPVEEGRSHLSPERDPVPDPVREDKLSRAALHRDSSARNASALDSSSALKTDLPEFDAIVVGAGPAGSVAAWRLASLGRRVALLERGAYPGAKNLFGGMIYSVELARNFPHFVEEAPLERPITRHATSLLSSQGSLHLDFACEAFGEAPYNGFTAYRSQFDRWLAAQAVRAGALLLNSTLAESLYLEAGRVRGVRVHGEREPLRAPLVLCADGILSRLGQEAGLIAAQDTEHYSLGVREVLALPAGVIEDRFQIDACGGCASLFAGEWPGGLQGGGFLYTNRETLSVGFVAQMPSLQRGSLSISEALDVFKTQPAVRRLIHGGERLEYGAHIVPEAGWRMRPKRLVDDGIMLLGDAAALVLAAGVIYEGVHYAMHSGTLAAEVAHEALLHKNFSARALRPYARRLRQSYVSRNLRTFRHVPALLGNPHVYAHYPRALVQVGERFFRASPTGHQKLLPLIYAQLLRPAPWKTLRSMWQAARGFL